MSLKDLDKPIVKRLMALWTAARTCSNGAMVPAHENFEAYKDNHTDKKIGFFNHLFDELVIEEYCRHNDI